MVVQEIVRYGQWYLLKGAIRNYFDLLTDEDIDRIGNSDQEFVLHLMDRYSVYEEEAQRMLSEFKNGVIVTDYLSP